MKFKRKGYIAIIGLLAIFVGASGMTAQSSASDAHIPEEQQYSSAPNKTKMLETYRAMQKGFEVRDIDAIMANFAENCIFMNTVLREPIRGREALRAALSGRTGGVNREEWLIVEGNRIATGWSEQPRTPPGAAQAPIFRGISTFVFNEEGLILRYEGMFDPMAMKSAYMAAKKISSER